MTRRAIPDRTPTHPASERDLARGVGADARGIVRAVEPREIRIVKAAGRGLGIALTTDRARALIVLRAGAAGAVQWLERLARAERQRSA